MEEGKMNDEKIKHLITLAIEQLQYSYSPYSGFKVGAALLTETGEIYTGCNIEIGRASCRERV